jgi:hypothetical protein
MLCLYDFNSMEDDEKAATVWAGTFLGDREENGLRVQLYRIGAFHVAVFYDGLANRVLRFRAFKSYLSHIRFNLK